MTQILKVSTYLMQNFMELDMKKFSDSKQSSDIWGLEGRTHAYLVLFWNRPAIASI